MTYFFSPENKRKLYIFFHKSQLVKAPSNYWSGINSLGKVQTLPLLKIFKRNLLTRNVFCDLKILKRCFEYAFVVISSYKSCRKRKTMFHLKYARQISFSMDFFMRIHLCLGLKISFGGGGRNNFVCLEEFETYFWSFFYVNIINLNFPGGTPDPPPDPRLPSIFIST